MLIFTLFFFSIQSKSDLNAILVVSLLSSGVFAFHHSVGREDPFGFSWKGKHDLLFFLLSCTEMGSEIDVAFFWTNILMRSSLSGGIALFTTFLGQSVILNTQDSKFLIWQ